MLVFVDEAGDVGFKFSKGSSRLFIVTMTVFEDDKEAKHCDQRIELLRNELRLPKQFEFHFNQNSPEIRQDFLQAVAPYKFFYFAIVVDKDEFSRKERATAEAFYQHACGLVFENAKPYLNEAAVVIDGSRSIYFKQNLQRYLKTKINSSSATIRYIKQVKVQDSEKNNLLQLADMVCGAINRSFSQKADAQVYRKIIAQREISVETLSK